jgi:hypothetical protein
LQIQTKLKLFRSQKNYHVYYNFFMGNEMNEFFLNPKCYFQGYGPGPGPSDGSRPPNQPPHNFSPPQLQQLKVQIMAYRMLARGSPLSPQLAMAVQGKRMECIPGAPPNQQGGPMPSPLMGSPGGQSPGTYFTTTIKNASCFEEEGFKKLWSFLSVSVYTLLFYVFNLLLCHLL